MFRNSSKDVSTIKTVVLSAIMLLMLVTLAGCGTSSDSGITLRKPVYTGKTEDGYPEFTLRWNRYPDTTSYEIAIFAQGKDPFGRQDFAIRSTKQIYGGKTHGSLVFLQGIYTDTADYLVKVRPNNSVDSIHDPSINIWSNLWKISFVNGEYEVSSWDVDFDEEAVSPGNDQAEQDTSQVDSGVNHVFPETLSDYLVKESGKGNVIDLSAVAMLTAGPDHRIMGEPRQHITDQTVIDQFCAALSNVKVTAKVDDIKSQETAYVYSGLDKSGNTVFSFRLQSDLLVTEQGRYRLDGLGMLVEGQGIISRSGWEKYLQQETAKAENYYESSQQSSTASAKDLFKTAGYMPGIMEEKAPSNIVRMKIFIEDNEEAKAFETKDKDQIASMYKALKTAAVEDKDSGAKGQNWYIVFEFKGRHKTFTESAVLEFVGNSLKAGDSCYKVSDLNSFYESIDAPILSYLKDYSTASNLEPVY